MGWQTGSHWSPPCPLWLRKARSVSVFYARSIGVGGLVSSPLAAMLEGAGNPVGGAFGDFIWGGVGDVWTISGGGLSVLGRYGWGIGSDCW